MNNSLIISESEKNRILSLHEKFVPKRYKKTNPTSLSEQFSFIQEELDFQKKVHLHHISMLVGVDKNIYLRNVQNDYALGLFENNSEILENFSNRFLNALNESIDDFSKELERLHHFILESLKVTLVEQPESRFMSQRERDAMKTYNQQASSSLTDAINYIKEKGITYVMENIRQALFSGVGTVIQVALSFTGAGNLAVTIVWGIMGLYDLYQVVVNGNTGYLGNLLIDIICCVSSGYLGKPLSAFAGKVFTSVEAFLASLMKSSAGTSVKPFIQIIIGGFKTLMNWFGQAATFMKDKMGINWVSNIISKIEPYYTKIVEWFSKNLQGSSQKVGSLISSLVSPTLLRTSAILARRFNPAVFSKVASLTEREVGEYVGKELEKTTLKYIEKESNSRFKESPTEDFLRWVDSNFGTAYGDLYLAYLGGKKLFKYNNDGKYLKVAEVGANTARGEFDYTGAKAGDIQQGTKGVVKKVGT